MIVTIFVFKDYSIATVWHLGPDAERAVQIISDMDDVVNKVSTEVPNLMEPPKP